MGESGFRLLCWLVTTFNLRPRMKLIILFFLVVILLATLCQAKTENVNLHFHMSPESTQHDGNELEKDMEKGQTNGTDYTGKCEDYWGDCQELADEHKCWQKLT